MKISRFSLASLNIGGNTGGIFDVPRSERPWPSSKLDAQLLWLRENFFTMDLGEAEMPAIATEGQLM